MEDIHGKVMALHRAHFATSAAATTTPDVSKDKLSLSGAVHGAVVTRFPPEASGFLHIGHAKAALVNRMLADKYDGKMLFRFDDTNPSKEKEHYEEAIEHDLRTLGVRYDSGPTYSSDYFDYLRGVAEDLIARGLAYCDKTPREEMQRCRFDGIATAYRDASVDENMRLWREMLAGSDEGQQTCLRAKVSLTDANKAMRDPVMYRVNLTPHARHGTTYKAYPTYDFCCPLIDSLEGVTHALRTNEYHDRNAQYYWFCDAARVRRPVIEDFSRLNMEYTVMSKRKLTKLVDTGVVDGWDDPRLPTVRALVRRGLRIAALRAFVEEQGMSKTVNLMQWSKLWYLNAQLLDRTAPRYTVVSHTHKVRCVVHAQPHMQAARKLLCKKAPELGEKTYYRSDVIYLDRADVCLLRDGDEVTLMDWCNAYITHITHDSDGAQPTHAELTLHPDGDVKKTKHKLTWVPASDTAPVLLLREYDHILTKEKPDGDEDVDSLLAPVSLYEQEALGEDALHALHRGDTVQLERRGYYICDDDGRATTPRGRMVLIAIPDGRDKVGHLSAKAQYFAEHAPRVTSTSGGVSSAAAELAARRAAKQAKKAAQKAAAAAKTTA